MPIIKNMIYKFEEIKKIVSPIFIKYGVKKAILFGSYAKNKAHEKSDIDICIDSQCVGLKFFGILEELTQATNKEIDLIDISQIVIGSEVEKEIKKHGKVIYEK